MRIIVKGKVQGVFFRASTKDTAGLLGITGWVKNLPDGDVEIKATADKETLKKFIAWCRQGPRGARVGEVHTEEIGLEEFSGFKIAR